MGSKVGNGVTSSGTTRKDTFERKTQHRPRSEQTATEPWRQPGSDELGHWTQPSGPKQAQLDEMAQVKDSVHRLRLRRVQ